MSLFPGQGDGSRPGSKDGTKLKGKSVPKAMGHRKAPSQKAFSRDMDTARVRSGDNRPGAVRDKGFSKR